MADLLTICNRLTGNLGSRKCAVPGGTNRRSWVFQRDQFTNAFTKNAQTGAISGFGLVEGEQGIRAVGRPKKGSGAGKGTQADTGSTEVEQTLIQEFTFANQNELNANEAYLKADGKVVFQELNSGQIRVYFKEFGNETATAEEGTGTLLGDESQVMKMTLVGKEPSFAPFFEAPIGTSGLSQLEASAAYLDALTKAA
ncbi:MAG: hypothetical protein ACRYG7_13190 [Janthinobacterium lividum]